jgi:hypothetical protein
MVSRISRIKTVLGCILVVAPVSLLNAQTALHLVVESQFTFLGSKQLTTTEYWITDDKTYERRGGRVIINRKDGGLRWVIDMEKRTYSETQSTAPARNVKSEGEDIRTAGFSYEPEFAWKVADGRKVSTINGRRCRLTTATGTDDFAEMTVKLWLCYTNRPALERKANVLVVECARFRYQNPINFVTQLVSRRPKMLLMSLEADVEPPISRAMHHRVMVRTIENAKPPNGIFDLPLGIQRKP